ncbi:AAA ATPase midasin, partial [Ascosphaera atra]
MIEYLAKVSGNRFVRINNHEHTDLQEYLGTYVSGEDGNLRYQEGVLVEALRNGYWIVLDELNLAPTDVLEALNRLLDDNRELFLPESQEVVHPHPNFMLFATQNPAGLYGGRKILSRAFRNRFLELHFDDIPEDELEFILKERSQIAPSFCSRIVTVYKRLSLLRQMNRLFEQRNSFATLRDLFRWSLRKADDREQLAANGFMLLAERVRNPQEREAVKKIIEEVMKVKLDDDNIYSSQALEFRLQQAGLAPPTGIIWT